MEKVTTTGYDNGPKETEGKTYGYQRPVEALAEVPPLTEQRNKVVSAFAEFVDTLAARSMAGAACAPAADAGTSPAPASAAPAAGTGASGTAAPPMSTRGDGGAPAVGSGTAGTVAPPMSTRGDGGATPAVGSGTAGTVAPPMSTRGDGGTAPARGTGGTAATPMPYPGDRGGAPDGGASGGGSMTRRYAEPNGPLSPADDETPAAEAEGISVFALREAYRLDRARENKKAAARDSKRALLREASPQAPSPLAVPADDRHQPVANHAADIEMKEFGPAFGSAGKSAGPTLEKVSARLTQRPETVPAPAVPAAGAAIDAYWGSFGTAIERAAVRAKVDHRMLEVIIGTDDRIRVTNNQAYPWRCICSLLITANNGAQYIGTGWLVAPRVVVTAGHCVYMSDEGGWVSQIEVIPGRNGTQRPFGSAIAREFRSATGWTRDGDSDCDYGVILLPSDKRYGDQLGWFGYANRDDAHLRGITLNLAGYPGDGGKAPNRVEGSQWFHSRAIKEVQATQLTYEIDTYGGQSGAPVWEMTSNGSRYGVAVHTWGTTVSNGGTRITAEVFDNIVRWIAEAP